MDAFNSMVGGGAATPGVTQGVATGVTPVATQLAVAATPSAAADAGGADAAQAVGSLSPDSRLSAEVARLFQGKSEAEVHEIVDAYEKQIKKKAFKHRL